MSVTVTIGRNVGSEPMDDARWRAARHAVAVAVSDDAAPIVFAGVGLGVWEGSREDAYTIVGSGRDRVSRRLRERLGAIAAEYGQDAIAVTAAPVEFVDALESDREVLA